MRVIRIQEQAVDEQQRNTVLRLDQRTEHALQMQDPFANDSRQAKLFCCSRELRMSNLIR